MKFKHSNSERTYEDAKGKMVTVATCDACKAKHKNDFGFSLDLSYPGAGFTGRMKLCAKCSRKLLPELLDLVDEIMDEASEMRRDFSMKM